MLVALAAPLLAVMAHRAADKSRPEAIAIAAVSRPAKAPPQLLTQRSPGRNPRGVDFTATGLTVAPAVGEPQARIERGAARTPPAKRTQPEAFPGLR